MRSVNNNTNTNNNDMMNCYVLGSGAYGMLYTPQGMLLATSSTEYRVRSMYWAVKTIDL